MTSTPMPAARPAWDDDALSRKQDAAFLEKYVLRKFAAQPNSAGTQSLCFAVDGEWGAGKTYFVDNWRRSVSDAGHPVVQFDAWANDLTDDPLVGFMASLRSQLAPWIEKLPPTDRAKVRGRAAWTKVMKNAGKAVLPMGKAIAKGALEKYSGVGVDAVLEIWGAAGTGAVAPAPAELAKLAAAGGSKFFETVMKDHDNRRNAVAELRAGLEDLLQLVERHTKGTLPLFVFVDELDRCRPDYAIRLLEGIKHLFEVKGVCFAVSTNLEQLSESVRAVYGGGFDARKYLKRFFSFEYMLPEPDHGAFALHLMKGSFISTLPNHSGLSPSSDNSNMAAKNFAFVCNAFNLDLRSQKQVLMYAEGAAAAMDKSTPVYLLPLFFFAALLHKSRKAFDMFEKAWHGGGRTDDAALKLAEVREVKHAFQLRTSQGIEDRTVDCFTVFRVYLEAVAKPLPTFARTYWNANIAHVYPASLQQPIADEYQSQGSKEFSVLRSYPRLLRAAGSLA